ncbi:inositol monophosphatase [Calothrix sp. NIES-4101]|nr:inositol monophosphatase [Calothrix sp. NIES-4101]
MTDFWTTILEFSQATSAEIGKQLIEHFGQVQADEKADGSLVTQADKWADQAIRDAITANFQGYGILSEEGNKVFPEQDWCWVIDPLDGTTNFTRGIPIWSISLGLLYKKIPVFGFIYLPTLNESFHGYWEGSSGLAAPTGAFRNNHPIFASNDTLTSNHFFNVCSRSTSAIQKDFPCKIRMLGVASYNFLTVANGSVLGTIEATPKIWDIAAAWVILQAAGGCWKSLKMQPFPVSPGVDYSNISFPTLAVSRPELISVFEPFLQDVKI